jgi:serine/threonine protein kinase
VKFERQGNKGPRMEGQETTYEDPRYISGYVVMSRTGDARPLYTYIVSNPKDPDDIGIAKYFDVKNLAAFGISKLEVAYFISDVLDFMDLGLVGAVKRKEGVAAETNNICFEYTEDKSLYRHVEMNGPFGPREALEICGKVGLVLAEAEKEGFFHLALNPRNVFLARDGAVTIKDWILYEQNVALFAVPQKLRFDPYYFQAPELLDMKGVSARADIYSLGLLAAFMVTGDWKIKEAMTGGANVPPELRKTIRAFGNEDPGERVGEWSCAIGLLGRAEIVPVAELPPAEEPGEPAAVVAAAVKTTGEGPEPGKEELGERRDSTLKKVARRPPSKKAAAAVISILVVLAALGVTLALRPYFQKDTAYTSRSEAGLLPSFVGMGYNEAAGKAEGLGIAVEKEDIYSAEIAAGTVANQDPGEDSEISDGMILRLAVSLGPGPPAPVEDAGATGDTASSGDATPRGGTPPPEPRPAAKSAPVVSASASPSSGPSSGVMVTLSASAYDPDGGSIVSYSWSCGGSGPAISREFTSSTAPKTVTVTVTVTDDEGQTASGSVAISLY